MKMKKERCKKLVNFKLPLEVIERLSRLADESGRTKTKVVELALADYLARKETAKP
jgi:predicted transcriptional regulator